MIKTFDFVNMNQNEIASTLMQHNIVLTIDEALTIQKNLLKRPPTLSECLLWSIQSSEHCSYKSSRQHLKKFSTESKDVILGAKEDAGIISVTKDNQGKRYGVAISHESHNHPSQIVPFEGAATGVGGNVRDVCCMGAEVIALADSLRFGEINKPKTKLIHEGVVEGIASYGNSLGIPNLAGDVYYNKKYNDNCLVTVTTLGIVREDHILHSYAPKNADGYNLILVGKATDNSGFAGASFASLELKEEQKEQNRGAVQEPNAFLERHLLKSSYALFKILQEKNLIDKVGFKDLGAGGIACASVELADASGYGAVIELDAIPTSMENLHPSVILCSETQERFMWVAPPELTDLILDHYNKAFDLPSISANAQAKVIGKITDDKKYVVNFKGDKIIDAYARDITKGISYNREYKYVEKKLLEPKLSAPINYNEILLKLLAHENIASRAPIFETYDKQVQGRTVAEAGEADAGVMQPFNSENYPKEIHNIGIALSSDHNPRYNEIDPYWGSINAIVEAVRNITATGAVPIALTDCLCFGNPEKPAQMAEFVKAIDGLVETSKTFNLPIIAGNVSFYNESNDSSIPASPIISCLGKLEDVTRATTFAFKKPDSLIFMLGARKNECGGSVYYELFNELGANIPKPNLTKVVQQINALTIAINNDLILAAHDIADGGIAVALAEMCFKNSIGIQVEIPGEPSNEIKLFSETGGFVIEVAKKNENAIKKIFEGQELFLIGETCKCDLIKINSCVELKIDQAENTWLNGLRDKLL